MASLTVGIVARILLGLLAGVLAKAGYDGAQQQDLVETLAQAIVAVAMAGGSVAWGAKSRASAIQAAVVETKIATLAEPELNRATLGTPDAGKPIHPGGSPKAPLVTMPTLLKLLSRNPKDDDHA